MWIFEEDDRFVYVGYLKHEKFYRVMEFTREHCLYALAMVNYLNGGDGNILEKEEWGDPDTCQIILYN